VPIATISFDFDPLFRLADGLVVRWQTVALAIVIAATLIVLASVGRSRGLRPDDLLFAAVGVVPGAVVGGRLGFALLHLDLYRASPMALFDPSSGGLELGLAVAGGLMTGGYVAHLLGGPIGRWFHLAIVPVLFALGTGKLTMVLGGAGQGAPTDLPWATAYLGAGPWSSLAPALPSHPSQAYEGIAALFLALVLALALGAGAFRSRDGRAFFVGIGLWALVRLAVSLTWRDPAVVGPIGAGGLLALAVAIGAFAAVIVRSARARRAASDDTLASTASSAVSWPDPGGGPRS
jgi:prolipoprotein diacylglyceryltransferase